MYSYGPPHMAKQKQDGQLEHTYSSYVRIRDVALKTCQRRWMIGRSGERGSGISVLAAGHDDDDDEFSLTSYVVMNWSEVIFINFMCINNKRNNFYLYIIKRVEIFFIKMMCIYLRVCLCIKAEESRHCTFRFVSFEQLFLKCFLTHVPIDYKEFLFNPLIKFDSKWIWQWIDTTLNL